jgi:NADPH-dependent 2,4-dienoyl-CoA reductase/sulfur reductase-like enzyme
VTEFDDERNLVVVGGGLAGLRAIEAVRGTGWRGSLTLVGAEDHPPYDRPPLSKSFLAEGPLDQVTPFRSTVQLREELGTDVILGTRVEGVDTDRRSLQLSDGRRLAYDSLLVATGSNARKLDGQDSVSGVVGLRTDRDAAEVRRHLDQGARVVIVGAGFVGSEVASAALQRGLHVTIIDSEPVPLTRSVGRQVGEMCVDLHRAAGVELRTEVGVASFASRGGRLTGVVLTDGSELPADLAVVGIGATPATHWLTNSDVALEADGGIVCGDDLATSVPGIWAAGDVAHVPYEVFGGDLLRVEHWTNAAEQGAIAGRNAIRGEGDPEKISGIPYFWSNWYGHRLQFVGTSLRTEEVVIGPGGPGSVVLYRRGDRIVGALTIDRGGDIMKLRRRIVARGSWDEAVEFATARVEDGSGTKQTLPA